MLIAVMEARHHNIDPEYSEQMIEEELSDI